MSGPIAISHEVDGRRYFFGCLDESELADILPEVEKLGPVEVIADGLAEVRERLPVGARVRTDRYWKHGHGTVTETCGMPSYPHWPLEGPAAHMLSRDSASVCVEFDGDGCSSWWRALWIERT